LLAWLLLRSYAANAAAGPKILSRRESAYPPLLLLLLLLMMMLKYFTGFFIFTHVHS